MYILAQLVFVSYKPDKFKLGMMFKNNNNRIYQPVQTIAPLDVYIEQHGYPVYPYICSITSNPDDIADILATPEQIGWWDEDPNFDELRDVKVSDFNYILETENSMLEIEIDEDLFEEHYVAKAVIYENKVTIRVSIDDEEFDEDPE
jgi:hypothetical protein